MAGDPLRLNQNLHCHYHQERGHTTEDCRTLWNHLEQLVKEGRLKQFLHQPNGQGNHSGIVNQGSTLSRPPLGKINFIFAALGRTGSHPSRVMSVAQTLAKDSRDHPKRIKANILPILGFSEEDKIGTIQPHDVALVVTLRIGGYDVRKVMIDQGSGVDIMYPNLFRAVAPRRQPPQHSSKEHSEAVMEEVLKLKKAGAIKEVFLSRRVGSYSSSKEEE
ncbi:uncharacterized protein LOC142616294 [Castanea sativa]|uniref:uncharacterized protein LOC142616294 n=1 Tax=Castanea sativa TaxID=21020 RepID=UPI003F64A459